jgi:hypothetical protein
MTSNLIRKPVGKNQMVYDPARDAVHILNPTAQLVEELHRQGLDEEGIARELRARFCIEGEDTVLDDVRACLKSLAAQHLVEPGS